MGCSSTNEELEERIKKLLEKRNEIRSLRKRKIKRLEKLTSEKYKKELVPDCYIEIKEETKKETKNESINSLSQ